MLGLYLSWVSWVALGAIAGLSFRGRPAIAIGNGMALAVISATWIGPVITGVSMDVRVTMAVVLLAVFCIHPSGRFHFTWNWLDAIVIALMLTGVISDWRASGITVEAPVRVYGEFVLPFFAGRFMAMRPGVIGDVARWFVGASIIVSVGSISEAFTGWNAWEWFFAPVDDLVSRNRGLRYDLLYRAAGPTRHPIFLGILLMLLVPWSLYMFFRLERPAEKLLGAFGLAGAALGVFSTLSRGPGLGLAIALIAASMIAFPKSVKWIATSCGLTVLVTVLFWNQAISLIESTESIRVRSRVISVKDEQTVYSGTRNRLWVWEIYAPLVVKGGPLGFGTEAVSSFPPNIPGLPASAKARETLGIVDNSYLLTGLRFGWIGLTLFVLLIGGSIVTAIRLRRSAGMILYPDGPAFLTAMASILVGVAFVMLTVFSSFDFMFWVYFHCGVVAGLASLRDSMLRGDVDAVA